MLHAVHFIALCEAHEHEADVSIPIIAHRLAVIMSESHSHNEAPADSWRLAEVPSRRQWLIDDYVQYTVWEKSFILMG